MILYFYKLVSTSYCKYYEKLTATFLPINFALSMARPIVKLTIRPRLDNLNTQQKYDRFAKANGTSKYAKKS